MARRRCFRVWAALIPVVLFITACGTTPYRRAASPDDEGYSDTQVQSDIFRVKFKGAHDMPKERAYDFVLLRAAEIAREHNFSFFAIMNPAVAGSYYNLSQVYDFFYEVNKPLMIRCFTTRPEGNEALDAALLEKSLKEKYGIKARH